MADTLERVMQTKPMPHTANMFYSQGICYSVLLTPHQGQLVHRQPKGFQPGKLSPPPLLDPRAKDAPRYSFRNLLNPEGEKSCSLQARGFGGTCPSSPPPRPPAAAQRAPRCSWAARSSSGTDLGPAVPHASAAGSAGGRTWSRAETSCWHLRAQLHT